MTRMFDHNLTGQNIKELIEEVNRKSSPYLEDKQKEKEDLYKSLAEVKKRIQNISEVIQTQGTRYQGMPTMLEDLAKLEKKRQTLEEKVQEINDATEEARLFINDPEGILAAVLDLRTYTETRDEEAAKELIRLFVTSIDVYDIQPLTKGNQEWRLDIQWTLPIFSERTDKSGDREIVILKKDDDDHQDDDFCLLGRFVGAHDAPRHRNRTTTADHAYDYGGGLLPFQRRVYRQRQPVETPPRNAATKGRHETPPRNATTKGPIAAAARSRGLRPVPSGRGVPAAAVQPLPEVLPHIVPVAPGREGGGGIPAGAPSRNSPAHP